MVNVYIIQSDLDQGFYVGISKDINTRVRYHNKGRVRSTKSRKPWKLIYTENCLSYKEARLREIKIKSFKGGEAFRLLIGK